MQFTPTLQACVGDIQWHKKSPAICWALGFAVNQVLGPFDLNELTSPLEAEDKAGSKETSIVCLCSTNATAQD